MQTDVYKTLYCFYTTKKMPHESTLSIRIYFEFFSRGAVAYRPTNFSQRCTFCRPLHILLNWRIFTQLGLKRTWTINKYACGSLISLHWLNKTHFWNLLSELFSTLRLSEILFLFMNFLMFIFESTFYEYVVINDQINISGEKPWKLDTLAKLSNNEKWICNLTRLSDYLLKLEHYAGVNLNRWIIENSPQPIYLSSLYSLRS